MKLIPLSKGKFAKVDDWRYDELLQGPKWYFDGKYARRNIYENGKLVRRELMHRVINRTPDGLFTDHIDGDCLNDQESNLRNCDKKTNAANMRKHRGASKYKGVCKEKNSWCVQIWKDNKRVFTVLTQNERHAAMIYDLNAAALFGEYARLNFAGAIVAMTVDGCDVDPSYLYPQGTSS